MPFFVAPFGDFQATLLIGPQSIAEVHNQFIGEFYSQTNITGNTQKMSARAFMFHSNLCVAVTLPTNLKDKGGREGLSVSFGVFATGNVAAKFPSAISAYIKIFINNLNRTFSLSLPTTGAEELLATIQAAQENSDLFDLYVRFLTVLDILFIASQTVEDLIIIVPKRNSFLRSLTQVHKRKAPKAILYPPDADYEEVLGFFLRELNRSFSKVGHTGTYEILNKSIEDKGIISLASAPSVISEADAISWEKQQGKLYLRIY